MLRTNLSTRPFYNERLVHLGILVAAILVAALTLFNILRVVSLSSRNTALSTKAAADEAQGQRYEQEATNIRRSLDDAELKAVAGAAREANVLIDQRTFSWTELFNRIESTLPPDVMVTAIRPDIREGVVNLAIQVEGKRVEDIDAFIEALEATGAFKELLSRQEEATDEGTYRAVLQGQYVQTERREAVVKANVAR
jgi:hypothetical protein